MSSSKVHKGGIFGSKRKLIFKGSHGRGKSNLRSEGIYVFDGGHQVTAQDIRMSSDGRRFTSSREILEFATPTPSCLSELEDTMMEPPFVPGGSEEEIHVVVREPKPQKRYFVSDRPLKAWIPHQDEYLRECIRRDGREGRPDVCQRCQEGPGVIRCEDCFGGEILCEECTVSVHHRLPLHRIERWESKFYIGCTLRELGLRFQLEHFDGSACLVPQPSQKGFLVVHTNGVHLVSFDYCGCGDLQDRPHIQLLRVGWWPPTVQRPKTCATFTVLRNFHLMNLQGHLTAYDFYRAIELQTDNRGLDSFPDRLASFMLMVRQYRHIKNMKRAGRGHAIGGILATKPGECAIVCGACPLPDINLPAGWEKAANQWIYRQKDTTDCNFRLSNRARSNDEKDPGLATGMSYFVPQEEYHRYVLNHADQEEISTCAGFAALLNANLKRTKGLRSTGVCGVACARHQMWRPNGLGDLQKGERYCNVDFVMMSSLKDTKVRELLISYDINCQWSRNLKKRMGGLPAEIQLNLDELRLYYGIPKFHLEAGHGEDCHGPYSLNFKKGVGRTDGEGIERNWSHANGAARSTREMGPGSRHDTLDDHFGHVNWRRTIELRPLLLRRMKEALVEFSTQRAEFLAFDSSLRAEREDQVKLWERMLLDWEADNEKPNPYLSKKKEYSVNQVRLKLAKADMASMKAAADAARNQAVAITVQEVGPSAFILFGLELEVLQAALVNSRGSKGATAAHQVTRLEERRTTLQRKLLRFRELQVHYMPGLAIHQQSTAPTTCLPEEAPLFLPSSTTLRSRTTTCAASLYDIETEIRLAQTNDALEELRYHLRLRNYTNKFKIKNVTGQRPNTQARDIQKQIDDKVRSSAIRYRRARAAHLALAGPGDWERTFRVLDEKDIRGLHEGALNDREAEERRFIEQMSRSHDPDDPGTYENTAGTENTGEGRRMLSWIWFSVGSFVDLEDADMHQALRVEWCKARARAERWHEEIVLLDEEMRRMVEYFRWKSREWTRRSTSSVSDDPCVRAGLNAYGLRQAAMFARMARAYAETWKEIRVKAKSVVQNPDFLDDETEELPIVEEDVDEVLDNEEDVDLAWNVDSWDVADSEDL